MFKTAYHSAARVDRGGRNRNGRLLRKEHLEAQRLIAERLIRSTEARQMLARAEAEAAIGHREREMRELMAAPSPR